MCKAVTLFHNINNFFECVMVIFKKLSWNSKFYSSKKPDPLNDFFHSFITDSYILYIKVGTNAEKYWKNVS